MVNLVFQGDKAIYTYEHLYMCMYRDIIYIVNIFLVELYTPKFSLF